MQILAFLVIETGQGFAGLPVPTCCPCVLDLRDDMADRGLPLMGVWMVTEGSKSLVRWTMWTPPYPEFGIETSEAAAALSVARGGCG